MDANRLSELEKKYEELGKEIDNLKNEDERWRPRNGDQYWCFDTSGDVFGMKWENDMGDNTRFIFGNVFKTKGDAEDHVECLKSIANAWMPNEGDKGFSVDAYGNIEDDIYMELLDYSDAYIGAWHKTEESAKKWKEECLHLFVK